MAKREKTAKTNAMRELERAGIAHRVTTYEPEEGAPARDLGIRIAAAIGADPDSQFKTLVTVTEHGEYVVCCIPVAAELDLKKAAAASGHKSLQMIAVRDLEAITGYVRGAVSPVGMRRRFPTLIDETAELFDEIGISGGKKGVCLSLDPHALTDFLDARLVDIVH